MNPKRLGGELIGFGLAGALAMSADLLLFNLLISYSTPVLYANVISGFIGLSLNFLINLRTFSRIHSDHRRLQTQLLRFSVVAFISFIYLVIGFELFRLFFPNSSATLLSIARVALVGSGSVLRFLVFRAWVFSDPDKSN